MLMNNYPGAEHNKHYRRELDDRKKPQEDGRSWMMATIFGSGIAVERIES